MKKRKPGAMRAWKMLLMSFPRGIAAFVTVAAGLSVSLPLTVVIIGLPLLAETFVLCGKLLAAEQRTAEQWLRGERDRAEGQKPEGPEWQGWRALLKVLLEGRSYRALLFGILQLPIGFAFFTLAVVLPAASFAVMLSPLSQWIGVRFYDFDLFASPAAAPWLLSDWTSFERSWLAGGVGAVLMLLMPPILRALGRMYAAWITAVAGPEPAASPSGPVPLEDRIGTAVIRQPESGLSA